MSEEDDHADVRIPPPVVGVLTIVIGFVLGRFVPIMDDFLVPAPARYWVGGLICIAAILVFAVWPLRLFRHAEQDPTPWTTTPGLITSGPYRISRNPIYLMMLLVCIGFSIILDEAWVFVLTPVCAFVVYLVAIRQEEAYLEDKFGDDYLNYKKQVRRWI